MRAYLNRRCPEDVIPENHSIFLRKRPAKPDDPEGGPTFERVAFDYLNASGARHKRSTCSTYTRILRAHILPKLGDRDITTITAEDILDLLGEKCPPEGSLAPATMRNVISLLRCIFQFAEPFGCVLNWREIHLPASPPPCTETIPREQQMQLRYYCMKKLEPDTLGILIALFTGIRLGEICALKWGDIDLKNACINIRRTVQRIEKPKFSVDDGDHNRTQLVFDAPKSIASVRRIPIALPLMKPLRHCRQDDDCYILTGQPDVFLEPRTFQRHYKSILEDAGIPYVHFHVLRHTFATNCVDLGFDAKALSMILGHSSVSLTLNTYVHPSISRICNFMKRFE